MVATKNLTVYQGSDFRLVLEFKDESLVLMDLTGYSFRGDAKLKYSDLTPAFSFTITVRNQATNKGLTDLLIAATATSPLSISRQTNYIYDIEMVTALGDVKRILEGTIILHPEVTK